MYTGATYDLELVSDFDIESTGNDPGMASTTNDVEREDSARCLTGCYGNTLEFPRNEVAYLLNELSRLRDELDKTPEPWHSTWEVLDLKDAIKKQKGVS